MEEEISKNLKILMLLNELGESGTTNILNHYGRKYRNDTISRKHIADVLDYYFNMAFVKKRYGRRNKQFWGNNPQVYEMTNKGRAYLENKKLRYNYPIITESQT